MRACDRRRVAAGLPIYVPLTTSSIIRGVTVSTAESLSYIRKSKAQGRGSSGNGRDASGRHPRSESVAFGLSRNGTAVPYFHGFTKGSSTKVKKSANYLK